MSDKEIHLPPDALKPAEPDFSLEGKTLVAAPGVKEQRYKQALLIVYEHKDEGTKGFIVNRLHDRMNYPELAKQLNIECSNPPDVPVFVGGNADTTRGFVLHSADRRYRTSTLVAPGLYLSATIDPLTEIANNHGPRDRLVLLGHMIWADGQLVEEMRQGVWIEAPHDPALILNQRIDTKWTQALTAAGIKPGYLSADIGLG